MALIMRYFKITTDDGNEYYFCKTFNSNSNDNKDKFSTNELFKMAIESPELPVEELDYIDSVEEVDFEEFSENYKEPQYV